MAGAEGTLLRIELVFSPRPRDTWRWQGELPAGSRLVDALRSSGLALAHPAIDLEGCAVGLWGRTVTREHLLSEGDRVEVYRPLRVDPKEARRLRYRQQRGGAAGAAVKPGR